MPQCRVGFSCLIFLAIAVSGCSTGETDVAPPVAHAAAPAAEPVAATPEPAVETVSPAVAAAAPRQPTAPAPPPAKPRIVAAAPATKPPAPPASTAAAPPVTAAINRPAQGTPLGRIKGYVTTSITVLDASGRRPVERIPREAIPIPPEGLPFYKGPPGGAAILVVASGREYLLDSADFDVEMAKPLVNKTCDDLGGIAPERHSPGSMGHGNCR
jgi:hypothetical protein